MAVTTDRAPAPVATPPSRRTRTLSWPAAALLLAAVVVVAAWRALFDPAVVLGDDYDFVRQFLPQRAFQVQALASGALPSWNPLDTMGVPYIASYQPGFFSPSTLPLAAALAVAGAQVTPQILSAWQVAHLIFAGLGVLVCARLLALSPWAGLAGGLTYALSGWLLAQSGHINQQNTAAWIPWGVAALVHLARRPDGRRLALAAAALAALILTGHPQIAGYGLAVLAVVALWLIASTWVGHGRQPAVVTGLWLAAAGAAALALAAVQLLPLVQYGSVATRGAQGYDYATTYSLPTADLWLLIAPHTLGPSALGFRGATPSLYEYYGYAGLAPLILAPLALTARRRRVLAGALVVAAAASVLLALGRHGILYPMVFSVAGPVLDRFRNPGRALLGFDLAMAFLAALGVDRLVREPAARLRRSLLPCLAVGAVVLALLALLWRLPTLDGARPDRAGLVLASVMAGVGVALLALVTGRRTPAARWRVLMGGGVVAFIAVDLALANAAAFLVPARHLAHRDAAAAVLVRNQEGLEPGELPAFRVESDAGTLPLEQNNGPVVGVAKTMGDDSLVFAPYVELRATLGTLHAQGVQLDLFRTDRVASPLIDMFGARYLFTTDSPGLLPPAAREKFVPVQSVQGVWIYENPAAFPLGWVTGARIDPVPPHSLERLDLRRMTAMSASDLGDRPVGRADRAGTATVVGQDLSWIAFDVMVDEGPGAILATSLIDYPGWRLTIDGQPATPFRVNHAFRGAWLPEGRHRVVWTFENRPLRLGLALSVAAAAALALAAVLWRRQPGR